MARRKTKRRRKTGDSLIRFALIMLLLLLVVAIPVLLYASHTVYMQEGVYPGVTVMGQDAAGMNREQVRRIVEEAADRALDEKSLTVYIDDVPHEVSAEQMGAYYDVEGAVDEALACCREGNLFSRFIRIARCRTLGYEITPGYNCDPTLTRDYARTLAASVETAQAEPVWKLEGTTLYLTTGVPGRSLDAEELGQTLERRFDRADFSDLRVRTEVSRPGSLDVQAIAREVERPVRDAAYKGEGFSEITPEQTGLTLDTAAAAKALSEAEPGQTVRVELTVTNPRITKAQLEEVLFRDELGQSVTSLNAGNKNRTTNVRIACEKVNGTVLQPGEVFSYNGTVGKRTYEAGFLDATIFASGEKVDDVGGGICQVSSTLYMAALRADLEIVERQNHRYTVNYTPLGEDATVYWGHIDFRFRNDTDYPLRLDVKLEGSEVIVRLMGTQTVPGKSVEIERKTLKTIDFDVVEREDPSLAPGVRKTAAAGQKGYVVETYRVVFLDGREVERTKEDTSTYSTYDQVVRVGVGASATTAATTAAPPATTTTTTAPPVTTTAAPPATTTTAATTTAPPATTTTAAADDNNKPPAWLEG